MSLIRHDVRIKIRWEIFVHKIAVFRSVKRRDIINMIKGDNKYDKVRINVIKGENGMGIMRL